MSLCVYMYVCVCVCSSPLPQTFFTMCTPHLSSRRVGGVFGHYGKAIWQKVVHYFVQTQGTSNCVCYF